MSQPLNASERQAVNAPIHQAHGLPNRFYIDPIAAKLERDSVLSDSWSCIGFASDLKKGTATPLRFMGLPLVIVATPKGEINVFHNVCRHRGHVLVPKPSDLVGAIRCPYHSWTYAFDGELKGTPHIGGHGVHETPLFEKKDKGLISVRCHVWMDMIFINLSGTASCFDEHISPLRQRWSEFLGDSPIEDFKPASNDKALTMSLTCNWKLAVENYCESYHLPWVHPGLNSYSKIEDHYNIMADNWGAGQGSHKFEFSERAGISLPRHPSWPKEKMRTAEYIALFPNVLIGLQNDHFFAMLLMPTACNQTDETVKLYFLNESATDQQHAEARKAIQEGWREVFTEDISVCESMQDGRNSNAYDGGAFSPALDQPTLHFHQWVANRLPLHEPAS